MAITDRVCHGTCDPDAFAAIGRPLNPGPDYLYTVNLLYQLGIRTTVDFIQLNADSRFAPWDEAVA